MGLCSEGKVKVATESMGGDQNISADYGRFVALLDSSANLKSLELDGRRMFDRMRERNMRSWHSLINAYAANGQGVDGPLFVEEMKKGLLHFLSMRIEYGVPPGIEHHLGVVDVLGKAGFSYESEEFVERMPFEPTVEGNDNIVPSSPRKKYNASDMLAEKSRAAEFQCPKPYEGEVYEMCDSRH
ncbi:PREDICTED: pentatricopeptide repeat-containing protein At2g15690-like [Populus euphratica]|uniref:Pentatricopeptide repeat-containing protein At2g15690-like n=1 Tax=Populus euphratica TaxID=75702 RepID=A0AAJ6X3E9_POPEU|nr:PREDICTED: pentatricopeptide repeat-containing protein At2g15690-like [Populus euphratica]